MASTVYDDAGRRLFWIVPLAITLTVLSLGGFLRIIASAPATPAPVPLEVQLVEVPPEPPQAEVTPPAPPEPDPEISQEVAPVPKPLPRPKPPLRAVVHQTDTPRVTAPTAPPSPQPTTPSPAASGGSMGARALSQPAPEIPEELRHHKFDLVAVARFHITAVGGISVDLIEPTPEPLLNRAVLDALHKWRFFPALENGKPVDSTLDIRIPLTVQ